MKFTYESTDFNVHNKQLEKKLPKCSSLVTLNPIVMLRYAVIFFVIAIVAAIFGFGGIAAGAASIAKILFFVFIVLFVLTLLFGASLFNKKN